MRRRIGTNVVVGVVCLVFTALVCSPALGADEDQERLARQVVETTANIQPGDVVVIAGGQHTTDLMEAVASEVWKAGGMCTMLLQTDRANRARYADAPEKYLGQEPKYFAEWLKHIDVWIGLPGTENPQMVLADIPEQRFAKVSHANQVIMDMLNDARLRVVVIGYPTKEQASINGLDYSTYAAMQWKAVSTDYRRVSEQGNRLRNELQNAKTIRITTPHGTDITLRAEKRPIFLNDGIVTAEEARAKHFLTRFASLPGGDLIFAPIESSVNGKVVVPRHRCRYEPLTNVSFDLQDGRLRNFSATTGERCFEETMAPYAGPKDTVAFIEIGLNPELRVREAPGDYRPSGAAGMITLGLGDNVLLGGQNRDAGEFDFPLVNATLEVDGRVLIRNGEILR